MMVHFPFNKRKQQQHLTNVVQYKVKSGTIDFINIK